MGLQLFLLIGACVATGQVARELQEGGFAVVLVLFAALAATLYAALCGRDFSFVGQFVLSWLAVSIASGLLFFVGETAGNTVISGWVLASAWLFYFVYDLAALLTRRKRGEEVHAIADLFRDILNFITYPWRVYRHWKSIRV
jgi:FtsH-binding integral membrane protein